MVFLKSHNFKSSHGIKTNLEALQRANNEQNKQTAYRMGKNICKPHI